MAIDVDWKHGAQHMFDRHGVTVTQANEVINGLDAVWFDPDPKSRSGQGVRIIGYSPTARAILTVLLVHNEDHTGFYGANGWTSNTTDQRTYRERGQ